ncbi:MAG: SH3 domain-containing protein [Agathobacter sp.]|nr:SH3 domain-containing protein [Agathobacter sp.]MBQ3559233.1 SH3 domain-containing protein [Agathobacter sp.]
MSFGIKNKIQKIIAVVLVIAFVIGAMGVCDTVTYAYAEKKGMITSSDRSIVETKDAPSVNANKVSGLVYGKPVTVINETVNEAGEKWYQIKYFIQDGAVEKTGYCLKANVLLNEDATVTWTGKVNANNVSLWSCTGQYQAPKLATLSIGTKVQILDEHGNSTNVWYRVRYTVDGVEYVGWVESKYVTKDSVPDIETDEAYEDYLRRIGFPESYIKPLAVLHAKYPNWKFEPFITGLKWADVLAAQCKPGVSQTHMSYDDAFKSYAFTEYNWYTNEWVLRDTTGWVTAHPDYVAYHLDPRNWFNDVNIFMFESLSYSDVHTLEGVQAIINGTHMVNDIANGDGTMLNYSTAFMEIAKNVGASAYHLASRVRMEQGVDGTSAMISGTYPGYEGYYNYFNVKTYGVGDEYIHKGLGFARDQGWNTRYKSLEGGAAYLAKNYIAIGQDTLYLEKFDLVPQGGLYNHQYMTAIHAPKSESQAVVKAYPDKTQAFVFKIPVFEEMPEQPAAFTASGNRNNYLKTLDVEGYSLTPTFDGAKTEYSLIVDNSVTSVKVSATAVVSKSKVEGAGTISLKVGSNPIKILCKSESGDVKEYNLTIVRETEGSNAGALPNKPSYYSEKYNIGTYITGVQPQTTVADFVAGFNVVNCTIKVLKADGTENTGNIATGNKLGVYVNGILTESKDIVIYGDVNGDSKITMSDLLSINRHVIKTIPLQGIYLEAGDVNRKGDGATMSDLLAINRHVIGTILIEQ